MSFPSNRTDHHIHRDQLITAGDLEAFQNTLLENIKTIFQEITSQSSKKWLQSSEVRKMLGVFPGTLQNLRINRMLSYSKIYGIVFYTHDDLIKLLESNCILRSDKHG